MAKEYVVPALTKQAEDDYVQKYRDKVRWLTDIRGYVVDVCLVVVLVVFMVEL